MSILINKSTKVICQGITGSAGSFHTKGCLSYGTQVVAGVTPGTVDLMVFQHVHRGVQRVVSAGAPSLGRQR
jgi:succinyl-CoA synthetase alpha subunit